MVRTEYTLLVVEMRYACTDGEEIGGDAAGIINSAIIVWVIAGVS